MITIRRAGPLDARPLADLLNEIIARGGTTAMTAPLTAEDMARWMRSGRKACWTLAEDETGQVLGFQCFEQVDDLPQNAAEIGTFARVGHTGLGIGSRLFEATRQAAKELGYAWINANIRADNAGGLAYYQSRGFEVYGHKRGVVLQNGQTVDKVLKRYDL